MEENIYEKAKVVIVDDIEEVLQSTKNCLEFENINVTCFINPLEALEYLKVNKVDVLLLDFFMPEMNGDEFVRKLREFNNETIIILQTGYSDTIPPLEMIDKMNIQGYLDKLKGEDELVLMTKAAIKTSFLNKKILEKDKEIARLNFKNSVKGSLITNLINEAKNQLLQISIMNDSIKSSTNDYEVENKGINDAISKIGNLYNALNFEDITEINMQELEDILKTLLKPRLLISNSSFEFNYDKNEVIDHDINNIVYIIIEVIESLTKDGNNDIKAKIINDETSVTINIHATNIKRENLENLELLLIGNEMIIENNEITIKLS